MPAVIGIDPGSRTSGYGVVDTRNGKLYCVTFGCIHLSASRPVPYRLAGFADALEKIIDAVSVSEMAVENVFTAKNIQSILKLGQVRGVAMLIGAQRGMNIAEYAPATVKQAITGYGRATKHQVQYMVKKMLNLSRENIPLDASDALAVAICHLNNVQLRDRMKAQHDRLP